MVYFFLEIFFFKNSILRSIHSQFLLVVYIIDGSLTGMDKKQWEAIDLDEMNSIWCIRAVIDEGDFKFHSWLFYLSFARCIFLNSFLRSKWHFSWTEYRSKFCIPGLCAVLSSVHNPLTCWIQSPIWPPTYVLSKGLHDHFFGLYPKNP